eukprot:994394-Pleurochrysis_carterae.AAC.4
MVTSVHDNVPCMDCLQSSLALATSNERFVAKALRRKACRSNLCVAVRKSVNYGEPWPFAGSAMSHLNAWECHGWQFKALQTAAQEPEATEKSIVRVGIRAKYQSPPSGRTRPNVVNVQDGSLLLPANARWR